MLDVREVRSVYGAERAAFVELLRGLTPEQWALPTECPAYSVQGIATHVLGDDVSLLSRQRDGALPGLFAVAEAMPGADFPMILDAFNDRWVAAASFLSPAVLVDLLVWSGAETASFYGGVDLDAPCEPVGFFALVGPPGVSPYWQAIGRELVERWVHHSQIRRALGLGSVVDPAVLEAGVVVVAAAAGVAPARGGGRWSIGSLDVGGDEQAADLLTRRHTADEIRSLLTGPREAVELAASRFGRP